MAERGQRTELIFGGAKAEVSLIKTSVKPREARHDVKWPEQSPEATAEDVAPTIAALDERDAERRSPASAVDPFGTNPTAEVGTDGWAADTPAGADLVQADDEQHVEPVKPMQGVELEGGEFIDLTDRLAEIDERTKIEGMEITATIPQQSVPRERVRDAHWIATGGPEASEFLKLLGHGLRVRGAAAVVRWTKRTNQALGIIVLRKVGRKDALLLLELEWAQNMREPSERVTGPHTFQVRDDAQVAAERLVSAYAEAPEVLDRLADERLAKRAELLTAAREGRLDDYTPPSKDEREISDDLGEQWLAAAGAR